MSENVNSGPCTVCGCEIVTNRNVEQTGIDLCGNCAVDYQSNWRPEHSPVEPNIGRYVVEVRRKMWIPRHQLR